MLRDRYPLFLAGKPVFTERELAVLNKFDGAIAARVSRADASHIEQAIAAAVYAAPHMRRLPSFERKRALDHVVRRVEERFDELARALAIEAGKPIRDARGEVTRLIDTFRIAAEESVRRTGEVLPLDISPRAVGLESFWQRFPIGPCTFITPFNFPMNLVAHKVAPAIAVGCPFVLKPASATPIGALILGEILAETDLPAGAFSILPCESREAEPLVLDDRIRLLSFTGSPAVGWELHRHAGRKKVCLELGGNAACIVDADADVARTADRITFGAFYQSGQSCISVQRVLAAKPIYDALRHALIDRATRLVAGDPLDEATQLGPLISETEARRIEQWVDEAVAGGARVACGGKRRGVFFDATILEHVDPRANVSCVEAFGPVMTLTPFDRFADALTMANDSDYGLQAGVFTRNLDHAFAAYHELEVGAVVINDVPSIRVDNMPYGGVKQSGLGREGVRFAMEEMSEIRLMVLRRG